MRGNLDQLLHAVANRSLNWTIDVLSSILFVTMRNITELFQEENPTTILFPYLNFHSSTATQVQVYLAVAPSLTPLAIPAKWHVNNFPSLAPPSSCTKNTTMSFPIYELFYKRDSFTYPNSFLFFSFSTATQLQVRPVFQAR